MDNDYKRGYLHGSITASSELAMTKAYLNMALITELGVQFGMTEKLLPLKDHADGLLGFMPVFDSEEAAKAYSDRENVALELSDIESAAN